MSKVDFLTALDEKLKVEGRIFLNNHEIKSKDYDEVLWVIAEEDEQARTAKEFVDKKVLLVTPSAVRDAKILRDLGY